jgi:uncharacterized protein (DUF58 family)
MTAAAVTRKAAAAAARPGTVRLHRGNVYVLPTGHGLTFCAVLLVTLIGATNYNNSLAFTLTFLLASLGLTSMLHTWRNLAGLAVTVRAGDAVSAGHSAHFHITLDNTGGRERPGIVIHQGLPGRRRPGRPDTRSRVAVHAPAAQITHCVLAVPALRRGWLTPRHLQVETRAPLGLFRAWSVLHSEDAVLVYPRPAGTQPLPRPRGGEQPGARARTAGEDDFTGLRDYRFGDSPGRIHWRAAARLATPPVKTFDTTEDDALVLDYEEVLARDPEDRLCQLAAWVQCSRRLGLRFGLRLPGQAVDVADGDGHMHRCLRALATFSPSVPGES